MNRSPSVAIEVSQLHKSYGQHEAVCGIDLSVTTGETVAVLGPNGAGKTTTVEILEGLRTRSSGDVRVLGVDPAHGDAAWKERIGVVLQDAKHEGDFTVAETMNMWSAYYRSPRVTSDVLELVGLSEAAATRTRRLSGGQQQRLAVALALVGDPELVFLDEPTTGFDPAARLQAWQTIGNLRSLGVTVLLTTHYMDEAEHLADRIVVISNGRIVADGTSADLAAQAAMPTRISWDAAELAPALLGDRLRNLLSSDASDSRPELATPDVDEAVRGLFEAASAAEVRLNSLAVLPPTLEDTYLALTGAASTDSTASADSADHDADATSSATRSTTRSGTRRRRTRSGTSRRRQPS